MAEIGENPAPHPNQLHPKGTQRHGGILTPEPTPEVEDGRVKAERERSATTSQARPDNIQNKYRRVTVLLEKLKLDPDDQTAVSIIDRINDEIAEENLEGGKPEETWKIDHPAFRSKYKQAVGLYERLVQDPDDHDASEQITKVKEALDKFIEDAQYPESWTIQSPEEYLGTAPGKKKKPTKDAQEAIDQIMKCDEHDYDRILGIASDASNGKVLSAWRRLGCLVHPNFVEHAAAEEAFKSKTRS